MSGHTHAFEFPETRWTVVVRSGDADEETRRRALGELCELYWPPVYAFVRSKGNSAHDAEDLVQGFFEQLLRREDLAKTEAARGRLRSFLLASVKNYMTNEWKKATREKRGGGKALLSLDLDEAETRFRVPEPSVDTTPDKEFDRRWVLTLLAHVLGELGARYEADGKGKVFEALKPSLTPGAAMKSYAELAGELGMSESAVKVAAHRLRQRYGEQLRAGIADTLGPEDDPEEELGHLMAVFS